MACVNKIMIPKAKVITCVPSTTLKDCALLMLNNSISCVVVVKEEEKGADPKPKGYPIGFVSKTNLIKAAYKDIDNKKLVSQLMWTQLVTIEDTATKDAAAEMCVKQNVHHLIVLNKDKAFVGLLSAMDIASETAAEAKAWPYSTGFLRQVRAMNTSKD